MMPGIVASDGGGGPAVLSSVSLVATWGATGSSESATVEIPEDVQEGDLMVLSLMVDSDDIPAPDGWDAITSEGDEFAEVALFYKIADSEDASDTISVSVNHRVLAVFRGDIPITGVTVGSVNGELTNDNPSEQTVTASGQGAPIIVFGSYYNNDGVDPRAMSPTKDGEEDEGDGKSWLAWKIFNSDPEDVSVDMDDEGTYSILQSFYLQLS